MLTKRETNNILAALRYWQSQMEQAGGRQEQQAWAIQTMPDHFQNDDGEIYSMDAQEIDELCDKLNPDGAVTDALAELSEWMRTHTGPQDGTHEMLVRAVRALTSHGRA